MPELDEKRTQLSKVRQIVVIGFDNKLQTKSHFLAPVYSIHIFFVRKKDVLFNYKHRGIGKFYRCSVTYVLVSNSVTSVDKFLWLSINRTLKNWGVVWVRFLQKKGNLSLKTTASQ